MDIVAKTVEDIKALRIQGASNIRKGAVSAIVTSCLRNNTSSERIFRRKFIKDTRALFNSRPTEPELRTALRILKKSISQKTHTVEEMKEIISRTAQNYENDRLESLKRIADYGAEIIPRGATILTHCHSSSVVNSLIKAKSKIRAVYCCEARPLYQGRITVAELNKSGINAITLVDNAASTIVKKCDLFLTGADALLADGDVINKIGTNQLSTVCKRYEVPHYVLTSTHKFEPASFFGKEEPIEERNPDEVWNKFERGKIKALNPAFDRTDSKYIEGIICELGVFAPQMLTDLLYKKLDLEKHHKEFLRL
ncbi:MAG: S-methyl-5-thioribose-1-phosphate isomerase [Candidatus Diapherotrites archaeon]|nr:S-methyl-5-thioribose-1-phosphate isomerase [Candidatus Diapherotrites archaeon]